MMNRLFFGLCLLFGLIDCILSKPTSFKLCSGIPHLQTVDCSFSGLDDFQKDYIHQLTDQDSYHTLLLDHNSFTHLNFVGILQLLPNIKYISLKDNPLADTCTDIVKNALNYSVKVYCPLVMIIHWYATWI